MFCISKEWLVFTFLHIQVVSVFQQSNLNVKHYCKRGKKCNLTHSQSQFKTEICFSRQNQYLTSLISYCN